jgi:hypothetical protein
MPTSSVSRWTGSSGRIRRTEQPPSPRAPARVGPLLPAADIVRIVSAEAERILANAAGIVS